MKWKELLNSVHNMAKFWVRKDKKRLYIDIYFCKKKHQKDKLEINKN